MKKIFTLLLLVSMMGSAIACNLSDVSLIGVTAGPGANTTISLRLCMGYGITGSTKGANGATSGITFGWYNTTACPSFSVLSFTPASISNTGITTPACTMAGQIINNPGGPAFVGVDVGVFYIMPGGCTNRFLCITSTPNCSDVGYICMDFSFVVNCVPDSMRVFGVEGAGNAVSGCYPNPDMLLDFHGSLPIRMEDPLGYSGFRMYPNPVADYLNLYFECSRPDPISICVFDATGKRVSETKDDTTYGSNLVGVEFISLPSGTYFVRVSNSRGSIVRKIIKI